MSRLVPPGAHEAIVELAEGPVRLLRSSVQGEGGSAPGGGALPAVLIHGGGSDNSGISWYRCFEPFAREREVIAIDLPGFGGSMAIEPVGGPREMAAFVARVLDRLDVPRAVAFGVSMGGDVALNLALDHPRLVHALVLIAPGGLVPIVRNPATHTAAWIGTRLPDWLLLPMSRLANRFVDAALRAMVKDPATLPDVVVEEFVRESRHPRGGIAYGRYNQATIGRRGMLNDLTSRVAEITVPTLLFHGADDPLVDPEGSRRAAERMPRARLVLVPDCGHWAQLEAHERFLEEVGAFLQDVEVGAGA